MGKKLVKLSDCEFAISRFESRPDRHREPLIDKGSLNKKEKCDSKVRQSERTPIGGCGSNTEAMNCTVKVCTANGDVNKRWYVYYYLQQGTIKRRVRIYGQVNYAKDKAEKLKLLSNLQDFVKSELSRGYAVTDGQPKPFHDPVFMTLSDLITKVLAEKKGYQKERSYGTTKSHLGKFLEYLKNNSLAELSPNSIKKQHINEFRIHLKSKLLSNRTINNYMVDVDAFFNYLINNYEEHFRTNPCRGITMWPTRSETHIAYTEDEARKISKWLNEYDPQLHLFCKFIIYCFLRIDEIRTIKLQDIDWDRKTVRVSAYSMKTNRPQIKFIPDILFDEIVKYKNLPKHFFLFTTNREPGTTRIGKNYFRDHYKVLKKELKFSNQHTMYGLRHTFVCHLIDNGAVDLEVMKLTGHTTLASFERYKASIMARRPKDLSDKYSINF